MCIQNSICMVIVFCLFEDHILTFSSTTPSSMLIFLWIQEWKIYEFHVYILWPLLNLLLFLLPPPTPPPPPQVYFACLGAIAGGALGLLLALFSDITSGKARRTTWRCLGSNPRMYNKYFSCLLSLQPYIH